MKINTMWSYGLLVLSVCFAWVLEAQELPVTQMESAGEEHVALKRAKHLSIEYRTLRQIKNALINGDTAEARRGLLKLKYAKGSVADIKLRYESWLYFIEGDHGRSLAILNDPLFRSPGNFKRICHIKIVNMVIMNQTDKLDEELFFCSNFAKDSPSDYFWTRQLVAARLKAPDLLSGRLVEKMGGADLSNEDTMLWLKLAIYMDQEEVALPYISSLPERAFDSKKIRDLVGLLYYRTKKFKTALSFIEDITTANAENIRGNIYLGQKKYELAYSHFKLALQKKQNSRNAVERAVPLAWTLEQWEDGQKLSRKLPSQTLQDEIKRTVLESAFFTRSGKYAEAFRLLDDISKHFSESSPVEFSQLVFYNAIQLGKMDIARKYADRACKGYDGFACWMLYSTLLWENLSDTMKRAEKTAPSPKEAIAELKKEAPADPIQEDAFIDQRDIEELDDTMISSRR